MSPTWKRGRIGLGVITLTLFGACGAAPHAETAAPARAHQDDTSPSRSKGALEVEAEEVARLHRAGQARVVDIRDRAELTDDVGHIPGVLHIPLDELSAAAEAWDPSDPIVLICRSGRRSARAGEDLEEMGFREARTMVGGMLRWKALGLETSGDLGDLGVDEAPAP